MYGPRKSEPRSGKCPYCNVSVRFEPHHVASFEAKFEPETEGMEVHVYTCPECIQLIIILFTGVTVYDFSGDAKPAEFTKHAEHTIWPLYATRPIPADVPADIAADYLEAASVLNLSLKASAALSRRCLQSILRGQGYSQHDLSKQINAALPNLPSYIAGDVDAIRNIGNFAAHPGKDTNTGALIDVEPGEAEWNLDVLDQLFDFYYVQPARRQAKVAALNTKLQAAGKPPMK
jgi:hypothetical protein